MMPKFSYFSSGDAASTEPVETLLKQKNDLVYHIEMTRAQLVSALESEEKCKAQTNPYTDSLKEDCNKIREEIHKMEQEIDLKKEQTQTLKKEHTKLQTETADMKRKMEQAEAEIENLRTQAEEEELKLGEIQRNITYESGKNFKDFTRKDEELKASLKMEKEKYEYMQREKEKTTKKLRDGLYILNSNCDDKLYKLINDITELSKDFRMKCDQVCRNSTNMDERNQQMEDFFARVAEKQLTLAREAKLIEQEARESTQELQSFQ